MAEKLKKTPFWEQLLPSGRLRVKCKNSLPNPDLLFYLDLVLKYEMEGPEPEMTNGLFLTTKPRLVKCLK